MNFEPKIGDWIRPTDPIINQINYGYNMRLIIDINVDEFVTTCDAFGVEKGLWNTYNTEFVGRVVLNKVYD
jgi:hypothetical protein